MNFAWATEENFKRTSKIGARATDIWGLGFDSPFQQLTLCTGCIRCTGTFWFGQPAILGAMRVAYHHCLRTYHFISQGYSEVEKSLQRCCNWVFCIENLWRHTYYVNLRRNCDIRPLVTGKWVKTLSFERCLVEAREEGGPLTVESMLTSSGSCSHDCFLHIIITYGKPHDSLGWHCKLA